MLKAKKDIDVSYWIVVADILFCSSLDIIWTHANGILQQQCIMQTI